MTFIILFTDNPAADPGIRAEFMAAHLSFLAHHSDVISAAGPLTDADRETGAGGLWLVDVKEAAEAENLVRQDPFWPTGLRESYQILHWNKVFADGVVLLSPDPRTAG